MPKLPIKSKVPATKQVSGKKKKGRFVQRHHFVLGLIIVIGWLVPPLAIVIRFGIGIDFFINIILTCCGYFPGHIHNWYCQNIRNNYGRGRTPKWALKAGLVQDDTEYVASTRQWGHRYGERNVRNAYEDTSRPYEDADGNVIEHNAVERFVENHGIHPSQPAGGLGPRGNDIVRVEDGGDDLLAGLPDEDRDRRRRQKANRQREYGAGLDEQDREEQNRSDPFAIRERNNNSLVDDLDDPDRRSKSRSNNRLLGSAAPGLGGRTSSMHSDHSNESGNSRRFGGLGPKKSGRAKKSERYGLAPDHRDLNSSDRPSSASRGDNNPYSSGNARSQGNGSALDQARRANGANNNPYASQNSSCRGYDNAVAENDKYDIRTSSDRKRGGSGRARNDDNEDFLNHVF